MGTSATMEADFFKAPFRKAGIEVVTPEAEERAYIADHILNELEMGIVSDQTAAHILKIMVGRIYHVGLTVSDIDRSFAFVIF